MPKKIKQEDTDLYKKLLVGFSFGQLVLGFLYFMFAAINLPTIAVLLGISIVCMILVRAFWEDKKFIRILVRVVSLTFILGVLILVAVTGIMGLSSLGNNCQQLGKRVYIPAGSGAALRVFSVGAAGVLPGAGHGLSAGARLGHHGPAHRLRRGIGGGCLYGAFHLSV